MRLLIFYIISISSATSLAQSRQATLDIQDVVNDRRGLHIILDVSISNQAKSDYDNEFFIIYMIAREGDLPLSVADVKTVAEFQSRDSEWSKFQGLTGDTQRLEVLCKSNNWRSAFTIYPLLMQGSANRLEEIISIIDGEFDSINSVLNVIYKFGFKPLTYAEYTVN